MYPRTLDYGIKENDLKKALVASVRKYYDDFHRLMTVRYCEILQMSPGNESISFERFPNPEEGILRAKRHWRKGDRQWLISRKNPMSSFHSRAVN